MAGKKDKVKDSERFSIIVEDFNTCICCGSHSQICLHEIFHGCNRAKSKEDGMIIPLCFTCHQGPHGLHNNPKMDEYYKVMGEKIWLEHNQATVEDFIKRFGINYI